MSGKIEISREQLEYWCVMLRNGLPDTVESMIQTVIAAPVVERQEPVAYIVEAIDPNNGHIRRRGLHWHSVETLRGTRDFKEWIGENVTKEQPLYTSQTAPVADDLVRLLTRARIYARGEFRDEIDACLAGKTAPVAVSVTEQELQSLADEAFRKWEKTGNPVSGVNGYMAAKAGFREGAAWATCAQLSLDKVKELNQ